jgi:flavin reductase (DIM6/NTAB) family NADH-FMN oxidoreductase RutF
VTTGSESGVDLVELFRGSMSRLAAGVAVVTCCEEDGRVRGLTATSVTAYSADPPSIVLSVGRTSRSYDALVGRPRFAVHLLAEGQESVAADFARPDDRKFELHPWRPGPDGIPLLDGVLAVLVCRNDRVFEHGDHAVVIGRLEGGEVTERSPLVYFERGFRPLADPQLEDVQRKDL